MALRSWPSEMLRASSALRVSSGSAHRPEGPMSGRRGIITCIDPRVDVRALGIRPRGADGAPPSSTRLLRTAGARVDERSLMLAIHGAGISEWAVVTHTDCGVWRASRDIDRLIANMEASGTLDAVKAQVGEPLEAKLREYLRLFDDPREAARQEAERIRALPFVPPDVIVHGLCLDIHGGILELVVDGDRVAAGIPRATQVKGRREVQP